VVGQRKGPRGANTPPVHGIKNAFANVRKLEEHLNPKGGKMHFQPTTLIQLVFGYFLSQWFNKGVI
jgi:hypothetical protein